MALVLFITWVMQLFVMLMTKYLIDDPFNIGRILLLNFGEILICFFVILLLQRSMVDILIIGNDFRRSDYTKKKI